MRSRKKNALWKVLARDWSQGKETASAAGGQDSHGHHHPKQPWGSVRKEVDAGSEEGEVRGESTDDNMDCKFKEIR